MPAGLRDRQLDQVRRSREVLRGHRVADRLGRLAVLLVPDARPSVQIGNVVGLLVQQVRLQHVGEEVVVAVPAAAVVEGHQEQVSPLQLGQLGLAAGLPGDGIAQRAAQPVQDGGLQQEVLDGFGLSLQDLLGQVVDDVPVIPGEAGDEGGGVVAPLHRERSQLQRGDPTLGPSLQRLDVLSRQRQPHHPVEVRRRLVGREAQIGGADLDEIATPPQQRQRQRRVGATGDHQMNLWRQVLQQEGHPVLDVARVDQVIVVEHQHHVVADGAEVVEQRGEYRLHLRLRRLQQRECARADPGRRPLQRGDQVGPEQRGIVVALVEREPGRGPSVGRRGRQPLRQQRRLAEPGGSRHQRQRRFRPPAEALAQPRTRDQTAPLPGDVKLGLEQWASHHHPLGSRWSTRGSTVRGGRRRCGSPTRRRMGQAGGAGAGVGSDGSTR